MKNSDMKVIAIILSIALFFTIVTSNAVSIASVIMLVKDNGAAAGEAVNNGDQAGNNGGDAATNDNSGSTDTATNSGSTDTATNSGSTDTATNSGSTDTATNSGSSNSGSTNSGSSNSGSSNSGSSNSGSSNSGSSNNGGTAAADNNPIMKDPFAAYSKAANDIHTKGIAGYNKIGWQKPLKIEGLGILDSAIVPILEKFMTTEDEAEVKQNAKGSDDAKNRMPASNCSKKYIKSATAKADGNNYVVTIVMVDFTNPSYADTDGLQLMSREFLDYKDVEKEAKNIPIVRSLEGQIVYKDYTITAVMTKDGKFVSITHRGVGYIKALLNGSINATGELEFNAKYTDFKY
ncbi:MAG: hypothetical protein J6D06_00575 [Clostridia bacterium]|nr:hypothetical protein [Clostridia bacterium]